MKKIIKNIIKKFHLRKLTYSNNAVVGIVVAVLLIGLMVSVISIIQATYVPKWMEEREADHIEQVLVQFSELKLAIDTHSINRENNTPIATSVTLGSKEFPFLMSTRAYGALDIIKDACTITFIDFLGNETSYPLGIIRYSSFNAYYIPEEKQSFIYEAGAVITNQTSGNSISVKPSFKPDESTRDIVFKIVNITGVGNKTEFGGYDTVPIQTEFDYYGTSNETIHIQDVKYINIKTSYPTAWSTFLDSSLKKAEFSGYTICSPPICNEVSIMFSPTYPDVELTKIGIFAQIGPGWVE